MGYFLAVLTFFKVDEASFLDFLFVEVFFELLSFSRLDFEMVPGFFLLPLNGEDMCYTGFLAFEPVLELVMVNKFTRSGVEAPFGRFGDFLVDLKAWVFSFWLLYDI